VLFSSATADSISFTKDFLRVYQYEPGKKKPKVIIPRLDRGIQKKKWMPDQVRHGGNCRVIVEKLP